MKRRAYALAILLFLPFAAIAFGLMGAAITSLGLLKAAFDMWVSDEAKDR